MEDFRYRDDVEKWLAPMNYEQFWREIKPHCLVIEQQSVCDAQIELGMVERDLVLSCLKSMAVDALSRRHKLNSKPSTPWIKLVSTDG